MTTVILVIHLLLAISLVGVVLLQRSEGGGLGMGGSSSSGGGMGGLMTGRDKASLLTRTTAIIAALFMITSISLAILENMGREKVSVLDAPVEQSAPATPTAPAAPLAK